MAKLAVDHRPSPAPVTAMRVAGFKSLATEQTISLRPLTVLAGANSAGKSSLVQPLLLLKQTLEAPADPGPLRISGPNVRFTSAEQFFTKLPQPEKQDEFWVSFDRGPSNTLTLKFRKISQGLELASNIVRRGNSVREYTADMSVDQFKKLLAQDFPKEILEIVENRPALSVKVARERFFFSVKAETEPGISIEVFSPPKEIEQFIESVIHVPGLRGNPERNYETTAIGDSYPGTFQLYVASVIDAWQEKNDPRMTQLAKDLEMLGLTWKVEAKRIFETQVELRVGRLPHAKRGGAHDLVSIADVGFGVSQTLPVVVALLAARPGQLVFVEQPEIHLHPRAQVAMVSLLAAAARRGVKVIVETHSSLLLLGLQTLVAQDLFDDQLVALHWVQRNDLGETTVVAGSLDEKGSYGNWPIDFYDVALESESSFLRATESHLLNRG